MRKKCAYRAHRVQLHVFAEHKKGLWMAGSCGFLALSKARKAWRLIPLPFDETDCCDTR